MDQIIISGILLPQVSKDQYSCWEEPLSVQLDMISGRRVIETRGKVWKVSYSYDYMGNDLMRMALAVFRSGAPFIASVLPDNQDEMVTSSFLVEMMTNPTFAFSKSGKPFWHNFSFTLREERPH